MTPIDWAILPLKKYAVFSGRAPRAEYWWFTAAISVPSLVIRLLDSRVGSPIVADYGVLRVGYLLLLAVPSYAVTVRRLHDTDTRGWLVLARLGGWLFLFVPRQDLNPSYFELLPGWSMVGLIILGLGWACAEIVLFVFMFIRGTEGPNRYGPDPYGRDALEEVFA